jgi:hypothetical protein
MEVSIASDGNFIAEWWRNRVWPNGRLPGETEESNELLQALKPMFWSMFELGVFRI